MSPRTDTLFPYTPLFQSVLSLPEQQAESAAPALNCWRPARRLRASIRCSWPIGTPIIWPRLPMRLAPLPPPQLWILRSRNAATRSEEHTSELQSLMRTSYAVFCLKKKKLEYLKQQD